MGSWVLTDEDIRIPEQTAEFAINMSNMRHWEAPVKRYIDDCLAGKTGPQGKDYNMRWIASMVADVHRILTRGGIRSEEHTSELQSLMRSSYAVFCLKKKNKTHKIQTNN